MGYADKYIPDLKGILAAWNEFEPAFYSHIVSTSHNYVSNRIAEIAAKFLQGGSMGNEAVTKLVYESEELKKALSQIKFPLTK
jgi:chitinase